MSVIKLEWKGTLWSETGIIFHIYKKFSDCKFKASHSQSSMLDNAAMNKGAIP